MKTVGEVCAEANVTRKTLYYYDRIGLLKPTVRAGGQNYKFYDDDAVGQLKRIRELREAGLKIAEIKQIIHQPELLEPVVNEALIRLKKEKEQLEQQISRAEQFLTEKPTD